MPYPQNNRRQYKPAPPKRDPNVPLTENEREKLTRRSFNVCYWHLGRSDKTRKELYDKLVIKDIPADIIESTLNKLEDDNYINDVRYTENFIRSRQEYRKLGKRAIEFELKRKGISNDIAREALSEIESDTEYENAVALVQSKLKSSRGLERQKRTNRLVSMLARKGYDGGIAFSVVKEALDNEPPEEDENEESEDF